MNTPLRVILSLVALAIGASVARAADAGSAPKRKVLFFSKSSGFEHDAIKLKMKNGERGFAFPVLEQLGAANAVEFTFSKDGSLFTPQYLAQFDAFMFFTSGDLTEAGNDKNPPMTPAGKQALLDAVLGGKGFIGVHAASDSFHSPGGKEHGPARFLSDGDKTDPYPRMMGGEFIRHGKQQDSRLIVVDPKFPGVSAVKDGLTLFEEWYSMKNFGNDIHVILANDTAGMVGAEYARDPYPETWARRHGKGRVFYTTMGHRDDIWTNPVFQSVLTGGLNWALGRVDADVSPNLQKATPNANVLPKYVAPAPAAPKKAQKATGN